MGITAEASQGAIFKSLLLQSVNCRVFLRSLYFLKIYIFTWFSIFWPVPINPITTCQDDESNPHPSAVKIHWSGITLRSPSSVVPDSFGHEADISMSSEDKTAATGSKVAPRSMGSLFSPMEKTKKAQRALSQTKGASQGGKPVLQFTWE